MAMSTAECPPEDGTAEEPPPGPSPALPGHTAGQHSPAPARPRPAPHHTHTHTRPSTPTWDIACPSVLAVPGTVQHGIDLS